MSDQDKEDAPCKSSSGGVDALLEGSPLSTRPKRHPDPGFNGNILIFESDVKPSQRKSISSCEYPFVLIFIPGHINTAPWWISLLTGDYREPISDRVLKLSIWDGIRWFLNYCNDLIMPSMKCWTSGKRYNVSWFIIGRFSTGDQPTSQNRRLADGQDKKQRPFFCLGVLLMPVKTSNFHHGGDMVFPWKGGQRSKYQI